MRTLVWFRGKDLRVADHPPLLDAARSGEVIPLFVLDPYFFAAERARRLPHRMQFLLESLAELEAALAALGSSLVIVSGKSTEVVPQLAARWNVDRVVAHRWVEPFARERDRRVSETLRVPFVLYEGETLLPPEALRSSSGEPYSVFTPFARAFLSRAAIARPLPAPIQLPPLPEDAREQRVPVPTLESLGIVRNSKLLPGGERAAGVRLARLVDGIAARYHQTRDRMDLDGTSRLSQDLKFGTLSARAVWRALDDIPGDGVRVFKNELIWREFAHSTLWDRPALLREPFRAEFAGFPWANDDAGWAAWVEGRTGFPVVDAAARQLLAEGFVHNRARMIAASFLTKDLLIDYRRGEAHYMEWLADGDWAQNNLGWQWSAGCGCDAQPWFRVFNPALQGAKFDPDGNYVRRWVPELAKMPARWIHTPGEAPADVLREAGVTPGDTYPRPIVDHAFARERFLETARRHVSRPR